MSPPIITNSDLISPTVPSAPVRDTPAPSKSEETCASQAARRAQCVLGIIRISWNYSECPAGMLWRVNLSNLHSLYTPSSLILKR